MVLTGLAALALCGLVLRAADWRTAVVTLGHASLPFVALAAAATSLSAVIKAVRWWIFLRRSTRLSVGHVIRLTLAGFGLNSVLAADVGDVARVGLASRSAGVPVLTILGTLASDKATDAAAFATMCLVMLAGNPPALVGREAEWIIVLCVGAAIVLVVVGRAPVRSVRPDDRVGGLLGRGARYLIRLVALARAGLHGWDAAAGYGLSLLAWAGQVATYALGARAVGAHLSPMAAVTAVALVNVGGLLKATPGNVGVFQAMYVLAVIPYGIPRTIALTAAVAVQLTQLCASVVAGTIAIAAMGAGARRVRA